VHQTEIVKNNRFSRVQLELNREAGIPCELGKLAICTNKAFGVLNGRAVPQVSASFMNQDSLESSIVIQPKHKLKKQRSVKTASGLKNERKILDLSTELIR